ncbi:MAG TPA: hypothetical protein VHF58_03610 [Solirubrobacterales bacterium]|nr:hypothetical protein [Solirubrobacterales bacterium]
MSSTDAIAEIRAAAQRLRELSERLRDPELGDEQAAELAREAAQVVSEAGNEIDRALREAEPEEG